MLSFLLLASSKNYFVLDFRLPDLEPLASVEAATDLIIPPAVFLLPAPVLFLAAVPLLLPAVLLVAADLPPPDLDAEAVLTPAAELAALLPAALFLAVLVLLFAAADLPVEADFEPSEADLDEVVLLLALLAFAPPVLLAAVLEVAAADLPAEALLPPVLPADFVVPALPAEANLLLPLADFELLVPADLPPEVLLPAEADFELPEADLDAVDLDVDLEEAEPDFLLPDDEEPVMPSNKSSAFFSTAEMAFLVTLRAISPAASATASEILVFGFPF